MAEIGKQEYASPSLAVGTASSTVIGMRNGGKLPPQNGWIFWRVRAADGKDFALDELRQRFESKTKRSSGARASALSTSVQVGPQPHHSHHSHQPHHSHQLPRPRIDRREAVPTQLRAPHRALDTVLREHASVASDLGVAAEDDVLLALGRAENGDDHERLGREAVGARTAALDATADDPGRVVVGVGVGDEEGELRGVRFEVVHASHEGSGRRG